MKHHRSKTAGAVVLAFVLSIAICNAANVTESGATYICRGEARAFKTFKSLIHDFDPSYVPSPGVIPVNQTLSTGKSLYGYRAKATKSDGTPVKPVGYILVLLGNAMYAQDVVLVMREIARHGYDVYAFDYRGYGRSDGPSTVKGTIEDTRELVELLGSPTADDGEPYRLRVVYGLSAGGAVALNALDQNSPIDRIIFDGLPASMSAAGRILGIRFSYLRCPPELDPDRRTLPFGRRGLLIVSGHDRVLETTQDAERQALLVSNARNAGICLSNQPAFGHPLNQDPYVSARIEILASYLAADIGGGCPSIKIY